MPTIEEWEAALLKHRIITVDSTNALAQSVNDKAGSPSFMGTPKLASGLLEFSPNKPISITTLELLHALGRISTPKIKNLTDLSSTWARLRYIWAFVPDKFPSNLRLSDEALNIDPHQKTILSDEIGIGMSALIAERFFGGINPVDVRIALQNHLISGLHSQYSTSPDYIFDRIDGGYLIVECKGTQSGDSTSLSQLKRGTEQLPSLVFPSGHKTLALVIGTRLSQRDTLVNVIDPPSDWDSKNEPQKLIIENEEEFRKELLLTQISNLYLYSGATSKAAEVVPSLKIKSKLENLPQREYPPESIILPKMDQKYLGISQEIGLIGDIHRVNIFQGLSEYVYEALHSQDKEKINQLAAKQYQKAKQFSKQVDTPEIPTVDSSPYFSEKSDNVLEVIIFGKDGTMLRFEVSRV